MLSTHQQARAARKTEIESAALIFNLAGRARNRCGWASLEERNRRPRNGAMAKEIRRRRAGLCPPIRRDTPRGIPALPG